MAASGPNVERLRGRLDALLARSIALERDGMPFPSDRIRQGIEQAIAQRELDRASKLIERGEQLLERLQKEFAGLQALLARLDRLRDLATRSGIDLSPLDARLGDVREGFRKAPLSAGALEKVAQSATLALTVLDESLPRFFLEEAKRLGVSIREARDRGEDVHRSTETLAVFLSDLKSAPIEQTAESFLELRKSVTKIPRTPTLASLPTTQEEEEILREARNLARRLNRMKARSPNAQSAARLIAEVRAALSEDRRALPTAEEETDALWAEVRETAHEREVARPEEAILNRAHLPRELVEAADGPLEEPAAPVARAARRGRAAPPTS